METTKVLILGVSGMLGHNLFRNLSSRPSLEVYGTVRSLQDLRGIFPPDSLQQIFSSVSVDDLETVLKTMIQVMPDVVINCIGVIKQVPAAQDRLITIKVNALFPHRLAQLCKVSGARLIHISTDCVFDGLKGNYQEADRPKVDELYGMTKFLGEIIDSNGLTLRTSIIGHELTSHYGLIEWFLTQEEKVKGFAKVIYSGFPTVEIAQIIEEYVLPHPELTGLYHVSSDPISKYDLLKLVAEQYGKEIQIEPDEEYLLDRSLDSNRFRQATGYLPPSWPELVEKMYQDFLDLQRYRQRSVRLGCDA